MECSIAWDPQSAWGSAASASFFVALEQPGPWGREALTQSHLDPELGAALGRAAASAGGRALLIRKPGHHADSHHPGARRVFVAGGLSGSAWLLTAEVEDPAALLDLPWDSLASTAVPSLAGFAVSQPVLLVCTNAKRDRCCALRGRPIVHELAARGRPVWECSHTGGHRFAPTGIVLPLGQVLGRLTAELGEQVLDAAASGEFALPSLGERHDRGVSHVSPREAAALSWVRATEGITGATELACVAGEATVSVQHVDGRLWDLTVEPVTGEDLPDSCGKPAKPSTGWRVSAN